MGPEQMAGQLTQIGFASICDDPPGEVPDQSEGVPTGGA